MDSIWVALIPLPFLKPGPFYQVDPEADVLIIVPANKQAFAPWDISSVDETHVVNKHAVSQSGLRIKASSKHLSLASDVFKKKLRHFSRNTSVQADGRIHLNVAQGFDARAAAIVLNAVHGKAFKTPKSVDLDTLAQIAMFAGKFQLAEAVSVYADRWISRLLDQLPNTYNRELILWVYISHVFGHSEAFRAATKVAAVYSTGPIKTLGLPIDQRVIARIDDQRQQLTAEAIGAVYRVLENLSTGTITCAEANCDSLLLGELVKLLNKNGLLWPRAAKPFTNVNFTSILEIVSPLAQSRQHQAEQRGIKHLNGVNGVQNGTNGIPHANGVSVNGTHKKVNGSIGKPSSTSTHHTNGGSHVHKCDATELVASLGELHTLSRRVAGLDLDAAQSE